MFPTTSHFQEQDGLSVATSHQKPALIAVPVLALYSPTVVSTEHRVQRDSRSVLKS